MQIEAAIDERYTSCARICMRENVIDRRYNGSMQIATSATHAEQYSYTRRTSSTHTYTSLLAVLSPKINPRVKERIYYAHGGRL